MLRCIVIQFSLLLTSIMSVVDFALSGIIFPLILSHLLLSLEILEIDVGALDIGSDMMGL
jgi:hypothetical protein